ncbi:MAG: putative O-glycosylation ligase, exosortase A system-associated, partial [Rhodospirillales bacterium]|nr:putative O-glycosylation ligase, exosortase A system-associated [Rhodospirillales bacterium]
QRWVFIIGAATVAGYIFFINREKRPSASFLVFLVTIFFLWTALTSLFADSPAVAWQVFNRWTKVFVIFLITYLIANSKERITLLVWMIVICVSYWSVKGAVYFLTTPSGLIYGPASSYFANTNELARVCIVVLPLMLWLASYSDLRSMRYATLGLAILTAITIIGTGSRGGVVALASMTVVYWILVRRKFAILAFLGVGALLVVSVAPESRIEFLQSRGSTIPQYEEDPSFQSRLEAWRYALKVTEESPILGGGFGIFRQNIVEKGVWRDAHSSYFEVLGEHGYGGLALYLALCLWAIRICHRLGRQGSSGSGHDWARDLGRMLLVSIIGYMIGGIVKNDGFFEPFYWVLAIVAATQSVSAQSVEKDALSHTAHEGRLEVRRPER